MIRISSLLDDLLASEEVISMMNASENARKSPPHASLRDTLAATNIASTPIHLSDDVSKSTFRPTPILKKNNALSLTSVAHVKVTYVS